MHAKHNFFQSKLTINDPGDQYEQQADAMADNVMRMPATENTFFKPATNLIQRKCAHCEEEEKLQKKESSPTPVEANSDIPSYINSLSSKGSPLPDSSRKFFESRFGYDFSDVRVHYDADASRSSQSVNARAYTVGNNVVFNQNQFSPETDNGKKLLAHELTHVLQQAGNSEATDISIQRKDAAEQEEKEIEFVCDPIPVTHDQFMKKGKDLNFDPAGAFGITELRSDGIKAPAVQLNDKNHLSPTIASVTVPSVYIQKDQLFPDEGGKTVANQSVCDSDVIHYLITSGGASKISEGEKEHCSDFSLAFDMSLAKYTTAVNKLAKAKVKFKNLEAANAKLEKVTGFHPDRWVDVFVCLANKSRSRDSSDHKPPLAMEAKPYPTDKHCKFPVVWIFGTTYPGIGTRQSKDIIKPGGC